MSDHPLMEHPWIRLETLFKHPLYTHRIVTKYPQSTHDTPKIYPWYILEMKYTWNRTSWNEGWQTNDEKLKGLVSLWAAHRKWQFILNLLNCFVSEPTKCWLILVSHQIISYLHATSIPGLASIQLYIVHSWIVDICIQKQKFNHFLTTSTKHCLTSVLLSPPQLNTT